ncbi:hypothetical protein E2C01_062318 [Portunus trituberculatus]|uniref:Uncharacterized protein n=1 Tax=Portunus trituberculatus TaxID=210409 RepID=A0A5B7HDB0_PORTR|nr:hypothetical protein [Portunus trituberculatus]
MVAVILWMKIVYITRQHCAARLLAAYEQVVRTQLHEAWARCGTTPGCPCRTMPLVATFTAAATPCVTITAPGPPHQYWRWSPYCPSHSPPEYRHTEEINTEATEEF